MQFSELLSSIRRNGSESVCEVHPEWMQGRAVFGGLQAVLAVHAMRGLVAAGIPLRTLRLRRPATYRPVPRFCDRVRALRNWRPA